MKGRYNGLTEKEVIEILFFRFFMTASDRNDDENIAIAMWLVDTYRDFYEEDDSE